MGEVVLGYYFEVDAKLECHLEQLLSILSTSCAVEGGRKNGEK